MIKANLTQLPLAEFIAKADDRQHCKATFPLIGSHGTRKLATVYFELEPGDHLGSHTDTAEELLIILEGRVEVTLGETTERFDAGGLVVVPELKPHDIRNIGNRRARVLGVFGGVNNIVATFENEWTESAVVDTSTL